jgi:hypothetical protein
MMMSRTKKKTLLAFGLLLVPTALITFHATRVQSSDHVDTVENVQRPGADLTDVFMFPSPTDPSRVVLVLDANGLIPAGQSGAVSFDPNVLYQFKIDNSATLDGREDLVIQAKFGAAGPNQTVEISGPIAPGQVGTVNSQLRSHATRGTKGTPFSPTAGMRVFAGARKDPFFFDLERFCQILPDRCVPAGLAQPPADPNRAQVTSFRTPGVDFLANLNVLSIVVELPKTALARQGNGAPALGRVGLWTTTSVRR